MASITSTLSFGIDYKNANIGYAWSLNSFTAGQASVGWPGGLYTYDAFIRFGPIYIPQGATINSAYITLLGGNSVTVHTCNAIIKVARYTSTAPTNHVEYDTIVWSDTTVAWNNVEAFAGSGPSLTAKRNTPSITSLVQEKISGAGWSEGDFILIGIQDNGSDSGVYRTIQGTAGGAGKTPVLVITFTVENKWYGQAQSTTDIMSARRCPTNPAVDDLEVPPSSYGFLPWGASTYFGQPFFWDWGLRFPNCDIPRRSIITSANLYQFSTSVSQTLDVSYDIYANYINNAISPPNGDEDAWAALVKTTKYHNIAWTTDMVAWTWYLMASGFTEPLQEAINKLGYRQGNAIMLMGFETYVSVPNTTLQVTSLAGDSPYYVGKYAYAPKLKIEFTDYTGQPPQVIPLVYMKNKVIK
jgi:hypothetical protein